MKKEYIGIDLGSYKTMVYSSLEDKILFDEPTCIAFDKQTNSIKDIGYLASKIQGKAPFNYEIISPVKNGLINDDDAAYLLINKILEDNKLDKKSKTTNLIFTTPSTSGKTNRKVLIDIARKLNAKEIYIESEAQISALGIEEKAYSPIATLVCNIGEGISDIALLSMGEIIEADSTTIAGQTFTEAIRRYMIQNQHLNIGIKSAEYIKMRIASLSEINNNKLLEVKGQDTITSLPSSILISSGELKSSLIPLANYIALKITDVISKAPPELISDLSKNGLILTGGGSLLNGFKEYLQKRLLIPVKLADKPQEATIDGFKKFIKHLNDNEQTKIRR